MTLLIFIKCNSLVRKLNEWNSTFIVNENDPVTIVFLNSSIALNAKKKDLQLLNSKITSLNMTLNCLIKLSKILFKIKCLNQVNPKVLNQMKVIDKEAILIVNH